MGRRNRTRVVNAVLGRWAGADPIRSLGRRSTSALCWPTVAGRDGVWAPGPDEVPSPPSAGRDASGQDFSLRRAPASVIVTFTTPSAISTR